MLRPPVSSNPAVKTENTLIPSWQLENRPRTGGLFHCQAALHFLVPQSTEVRTRYSDLNVVAYKWFLIQIRRRREQRRRCESDTQSGHACLLRGANFSHEQCQVRRPVESVRQAKNLGERLSL